MNLRLAFAMIGALVTAACTTLPKAPQSLVEPAIVGDRLRTVDGAMLGLSVWEAQNPKSVILGVHGMNDYARTFDASADWWSQAANISVYAYDQRGFGRSPDFGRWAGNKTLKSDLRAAIAAVRAKHPELPIFVVSHSMGAGVVLAAAKDAPLHVDGVVLVSPGVWGGARLPIAYRIALNLAATFAPAKTLTGERAQRQATDNIPVLRMMVKDPLVIKETRLDAVLGAVRIMGAGWSASKDVGGKVLLLYGAKDQIVPLRAMQKTGDRICGSVEVKRYDQGWHMLLEDLQAETVWRDIAGWIWAHNQGAGDDAGFGPAASACSGALGAGGLRSVRLAIPS